MSLNSCWPKTWHKVNTAVTLKATWSGTYHPLAPELPSLPFRHLSSSSNPKKQPCARPNRTLQPMASRSSPAPTQPATNESPVFQAAPPFWTGRGGRGPARCEADLHPRSETRLPTWRSSSGHWQPRTRRESAPVFRLHSATAGRAAGRAGKVGTALPFSV